MFFPLLLLLLGQAVPVDVSAPPDKHPPHVLESMILTESQIFHLQLKYRYHIRIVEMERHPNPDRPDLPPRLELVVTDYYANDILEPFTATAPNDPRMFPGTLIRLFLLMDDVFFLENGRYHHSDRVPLDYAKPLILVIEDRKEKKTVWPLPDPDR